MQFSSLIKKTLKQQDQKRQRRTLHNGKRIDTTRSANDPKYIWTQIQEHPDT